MVYSDTAYRVKMSSDHKQRTTYCWILTHTTVSQQITFYFSSPCKMNICNINCYECRMAEKNNYYIHVVHGNFFLAQSLTLPEKKTKGSWKLSMWCYWRLLTVRWKEEIKWKKFKDIGTNRELSKYIQSSRIFWLEHHMRYGGSLSIKNKNSINFVFCLVLYQLHSIWHI